VKLQKKVAVRAAPTPSSGDGVSVEAGPPGGGGGGGGLCVPLPPSLWVHKRSLSSSLCTEIRSWCDAVRAPVLFLRDG